MKHRNLSEQLFHELGKQIVHGDLLPGEVLPKVETLSEMKDVSRTVVREALKGLSARKLVESSTRIGTVILPRNDWQWWDSDVLSWAAQSEGSRDILLQLTEVRLAIEPAAVRLAAKYATDEDLEVIRKRYQNLETSLGNEKKWAKADYEFHNSILFASHNELMMSLLKTMHKGLIQSRQTTFKVLKNNQQNNLGEPTKEALSKHKAVMEAICSRNDTLAYEKMQDLIMSVRELIKTL